jgi:phage baseplate assembly protein W
MAPTHFAYPFRWGANMHALENEQDTPEDVAACVECLIRTSRGHRPDNPDFGLPDVVFSMPVKVGLIQSAISDGEPRAQVDVTDISVQMIQDNDALVAHIRAAIL